MDVLFGTGAIDPANLFASLVGVVVGLMVWRRHRADRRARVFLWLALSELAFFLPAILLVFRLGPADEGVPVWGMALMVVIGGLSAVLFFHFGMTFPHRRPWLRRDRIRTLYLMAGVLGLAPAVAAAVAPDGPWSAQLAGAVAIVLGPLAIIGAVAACVAVYRSYREMTADERRTYRAPVLGVLAGMVIALFVDLALGIAVQSGDRRVVYAGNLLATAAALLFPLFFFTAAMKFRLLERHSQEYVSAR
jgi:hypothetical protein